MTSRAAATLHRGMDIAHAEALSRDDGELVAHVAPLLRPGFRKKDLRSMEVPRKPKVLLLRLSERMSGKGRKYYSGWLGAAKVIGFEATEPDKYGNPQIEVLVSEPDEVKREGYAGGARGEAPPAGARNDGWRP